MSFPFRIERTRNRHSRAVCRDGTIVIRLGKNLPVTQEKVHIENLLKRMTKMLERDAKKEHIDPFRPLLSGESSVAVTPCLGASIRFTLVPGKRTSSRRTLDGWSVTIGPALRKTQLHRLLWKLLGISMLPLVDEHVQMINARTLRVRIGHVRLRIAKTQWGSCSPTGVIMLNPALLFVPTPLLDYVIVHELAHRMHANHSARFWRTVESAMPEYEKAYRALRERRLPSI